MSNLIDAPTIRKFLELLHARAAAALEDTPPGVLQLCSFIPDGQMSAQRLMSVTSTP